jgi:hypothetical protein
MSRSYYKDIAANHPGSAGVVLHNLLDRFGDRCKGLSQMKSLAQNVRMNWLVTWDTDHQDAQDEVHKEKTVASKKMSTQLGFVMLLPVVIPQPSQLCVTRGLILILLTVSIQGIDSYFGDIFDDSTSHTTYLSSPFTLFADDNHIALMVPSMKGHFGVGEAK